MYCAILARLRDQVRVVDAFFDKNYLRHDVYVYVVGYIQA